MHFPMFTGYFCSRLLAYLTEISSTFSNYYTLVSIWNLYRFPDPSFFLLLKRNSVQSTIEEKEEEGGGGGGEREGGGGRERRRRREEEEDEGDEEEEGRGGGGSFLKCPRSFYISVVTAVNRSKRFQKRR